MQTLHKQGSDHAIVIFQKKKLNENKFEMQVPVGRLFSQIVGFIFLKESGQYKINP